MVQWCAFCAAALRVQNGDLKKAIRHHRRSLTLHESSDGGVHQNVVPFVLLYYRKSLQGCWQVMKFEFVKQGQRKHMMDKSGKDAVTYAHAREKRNFRPCRMMSTHQSPRE